MENSNNAEYMKDLMNDIFSAGGAEVSVIPVMQGEGMMKLDEAQLPDSSRFLRSEMRFSFPERSIL